MSTTSIAVVNQKGGVGKTTSTVSMAACAAEVPGPGLRVLVVDMDPQGDSTKWLRASDSERTVMDVLRETSSVAEAITDTEIPGLRILPAGRAQLSAERELGSDPGAQLILSGALDAVRDDYDLIIFDCPPALGLLTINALVAAERILVPVAMGSMEIDAVAALMPTVQMVTRRLNPQLDIGGLLPIRIRSRQNMSRDVVSALTNKFGDRVLPGIRDTVRVVAAAAAQQPITTFAPTDDVTDDYRAATNALLERTRA